jgi:hypothetical protein
MSAPVWRCEQQTARLELAHLQATFAAASPFLGLTPASAVFGRPTESLSRSLPHPALLGLSLPPDRPSEADAVLECYAHGADLVVAYKDCVGRPFRVDAVWRAMSPAATDRFLAAVELLVSVRTDLPDTRPALWIESALAGTQMFRLLGLDPLQTAELSGRSEAPLIMEPSDGLGCVLWRLQGNDLSYAEMVHPADFNHDKALFTPRGCGLIGLHHRLFPEALEKGVILRARVRGVLLPRQDDLVIAGECYAALAAAEPPLEAY